MAPSFAPTRAPQTRWSINVPSNCNAICQVPLTPEHCWYPNISVICLRVENYKGNVNKGGTHLEKHKSLISPKRARVYDVPVPKKKTLTYKKFERKICKLFLQPRHVLETGPALSAFTFFCKPLNCKFASTAFIIRQHRFDSANANNPT